jgi:hypothetical protein
MLQIPEKNPGILERQNLRQASERKGYMKYEKRRNK